MTYEDVKFQGVEKFKMGNFSKEEVSFTINVKVYNPNNYKIKVKSATLDVLNSKDKKIGELHVLDKLVLNKNESGSYPVNIKARLSDLLLSGGGSVMDLVKSRNTNFRFRGKIKVKARGLGKKFEVDELLPLDISRMLPSFGG